ncbi:hypothetical protein AAVH_30418, partial [Aphelenchoides avenae]
TLIPNEIFITILRLLHRFDLDGVQITTKRLRGLVEGNVLPLRFLDTVTYIGDAGEGGAVLAKDILLLQPNDYSRRKEQCLLDVEGGIDMARRYLTSTFIRIFVVSDHDVAMPNPQLFTAHEERINRILFERCNFNRRVRSDARASEMLVVARDDCGRLFTKNSNFPGSQVTDGLLHILCCAGCELVDFARTYTRGKYLVTDESILEYCFSSDLGAMKDRGHTLSLQDAASVTPELPEKCIKASLDSKVTGRVKLSVAKKDYEGTLMNSLDAFSDSFVNYVVDDDNDDTLSFTHTLRYDFPDQGTGMRLQIEMARDSLYGYWTMQMRRGNKDDKAFFDCAFEDA